MFDLLIRNGQVVDPLRGVMPRTIAINGGKIAGIFAPAETLSARETIDASGLHVFPGVVDPHVHWGLYNPASLDFEEDSKFAALGGITTAITYFRTPESYHLSLPQFHNEAARYLIIDYAIHLGLLTSGHLLELGEYVQKFGVTSFKFFMGYKGMEKSRYGSDRSLDDGFLIDILNRLAQVSKDLILCVHAENVDINNQVISMIKDSLSNDLISFAKLRPDFSETEAIIRTLFLAQVYGVKVYIVHLSSRRSADALKTLPWFDPSLTIVETCPHYLAENYHCAAGLKATVKPPLRAEEDSQALWEGIKTGLITTIGSDEAPCFLATKFASGENLWTNVSGFAEMGYTLPLMISEGYHKRDVPLEVIAALTSTNPAQTFGLYPQKGSMDIGSDADLVLVDLEQIRFIKAAEWKRASDFSIYEGRQVKGWPVMTISRGEVIAKQNVVIGKPGRGRYLGRLI